MPTKRITKRVPAKARAKHRATTREAARLGRVNGGFVDEAFPVDAVHAVTSRVGVDAAAFDQFLGPRIGRYRCMQESSDSFPQVSEELNHIDKLVRDIDDLRTRISNLPPMTDAEVSLACWRRNKDTFSDLPRRIEADLLEVRTLLWIAEREIEPRAGKPGRARSSNRDSLLHDVAEKLLQLGVQSKGCAGAGAADVLRACGIPAPDDPKEVGRIIQRWKKSMKGEK